MTVTEDAAAVLAKASTFDPRVRVGDAAITASFADALERHNLSRDLLLRAVVLFYEEPRQYPISVGDVIRGARDLRQKESLQQTARDEIASGVKGQLPPGKATHPGGFDARGRPVRTAYEVDGAIRLTCPRCDAQPGQVCRDRKGRELKIPCASRLGAAYRATAQFHEKQRRRRNRDVA